MKGERLMAPSVSSSRVFDPSSNAPPMTILRSSHKATVIRKFLSRIPLDSSVVIVAENVLPKMEELVRLVKAPETETAARTRVSLRTDTVRLWRTVCCRFWGDSGI